MPILQDLRVKFDMKKIIQRQGFQDPARIKPEMKELNSRLVEEVQSQELIKPIVVYEVYKILGNEHEKIIVEGNINILGTLLPERLTGADRIVVLVSTIGSRLENRVKEYTANKETFKGMMLDGIGSSAMHSMTQDVCALISKKMETEGYKTSPAFLPGMAGFPLTEQVSLLSLVKAERIGVTLSSSGIMIPRKSTSRVIGIINPQITTV
jgi:hypothetical protein